MGQNWQDFMAGRYDGNWWWLVIGSAPGLLRQNFLERKTRGMKRALLFSLAAVAACSSTPPPVTETVKAEPVAARIPAEIGAFGFDEAGMKAEVVPGEDFFSYANGTWAANTAIPEDRPAFSMFSKLDELSKARTHEILEEAAKAATNEDERKVGDLYASFLDEAAVEAAGLTPIADDLKAARSVDSVKALSAYMGSIQELSIKTPIGFYIDPDDKHPERYSVTIAQSGLGLPDRDYYLKADAKLEEARKAYIAHIVKVLKLSGQDACTLSATASANVSPAVSATASPKKCKPDAEAKAKRIFELEKKLAETHWSRVESRDSEKTYNEMTLQQLAVSAPGIDWDAFFAASRLTSSTALANAGVAKIIVAQPSAITGTAKLIAKEKLDTWREYLMFRVVDDAARFLPKAFVDENFDFYGKTLNGVPQIKERWKRGVELVTAEAGEAIGKIYVARYFPPAAKARAEALVKNIVIAMGVRIEKLAWMAPETKTRAKEKLAAFSVKIGYPDKFRDYSALVVNRTALWANIKSADHFEYERNLAKLGAPIDRGEWYMTPMQVNAYASFEMNELVFPAAILQPPFFDPNADDAVNYGGIGAVIGHELSHHFDDQGSKYDAHGALTEWWLPADVEHFKALTDKVVAQYNQYEPLPGEHVNGELTLGENMADLAGITVAYDAYHHALGGNEAPSLNGFTGDQRFFLGWAQVWRAKYRDAYLRQLLLTDPHSPGPVRCTVVRNIDAWYQAFNVQAGEALYTAPEARIRVW